MNSQPTVGDVFLNSSLTNRSARLDFPTPELPSRTILTLKVRTGLLKVFLWSWAPPGTCWWSSPIYSSLNSKRVRVTDGLDRKKSWSWRSWSPEVVNLSCEEATADPNCAAEWTRLVQLHLVLEKNKSKTKVQSRLVKGQRLNFTSLYYQP